jgi:hypothetical protein
MIGLLWAAGTYLAFKVRAIASSNYDESQVIIFAIYNTALCGIVSMVIHFAVSTSNRYLVFMVMVCCCIVGTVATTCMLFVPKWRHITKVNSSTATTSSDGHESLHSGERHNFSLGPAVPSRPDPSEQQYDHKDFASMQAKNKALAKKNRKLTAEKNELAERLRCLKSGIPYESSSSS